MEQRCLGCMRLKQNHPVCEHCGFDERSENSNHQLPLGTEVGGQFILGKVLGQGGFGITYIGWDKIMQTPVAVKEYFPSGYAGRDTRNPTFVTSYDSKNSHTFASNKQRFLREAESLSKLWNIPQIVRVLRHFEDNGTAYIAMEYVEGMDLRKYMKQRGRPLTIDEALDLLGPVIEALGHVHKAELVHRDISPDNIMVLPDGSTKLLDFGAARYVENANAEQDRNTSTQAILKHGFAPPEQYSSHGALGPWTDVYAMCATLYYCLSGRVPTEAMNRIMEGGQIDWSSISGLTRRQLAALEAGMALQPKNRLKSMEALHSELFSDIPASEDKQEPDEARKQEQARLAEETRRKEDAQLAEEQRRKESLQNKQDTHQNQNNETRKRTKLLPVLALILALVAAVGAGTRILNQKDNMPVQIQTTQLTVSTEETSTPDTAPVVIAESDIAETTVPMVTETEPPPPVWANNLMDKPVRTESEYLVDWWEQNKGRYSGMTHNFSISWGDQSVSMPSAAHDEYLLSVPIFHSNIPRSKISAVYFLDTLADAPEDAWDVSLRVNRHAAFSEENTVLAWVVPDSGLYRLYIAAEGGINGRDAASRLFDTFVNLREVHFNGCFHTDTAVDISSMFGGCEKLTNVDFHTLNTRNVTGMSFLFYKCASLTELDLSNLDTGSATTISGMFNGCSGLTELDLSHFDTSNVTDMYGVFSGCSGLTELDLGSFDTSHVTDMSSMFFGCTNLRGVNVTGFDTSNVTDMSYMFYDCSVLGDLDISGFDFSKITDASAMFDLCNINPPEAANLPTSWS